jgi:hypothetical protein
MKRLLWILLIVGIGLPSGSALATTFLTEDFDYASGTAITATGNWAAHNAGGTNAIAVTTSGLSYSGYPGGVGNAASMTTNGEDDHTTAAFTHSSGAIYYAFLANFSAAQATGDYFAHFYQSSSLFYGRTFCKLVSGSLNFGITRGSGTANYSATPFALNTTHLIVVKYNIIGGLTNDTADLFVDPVISPVEPAPLVSATDVGSTDATSIIGAALRQGSASNAPTQWVDGIRVATTWSEAVGSVVTDGACCNPETGECTITSANNCSFVWHGDWTSCVPNPCPPPITGACCFQGGACLLLTPTQCGVQGGTYQGNNTTCTPVNPCPQEQGACCLPSGFCVVGNPAECAAQNGVYQGANTVCTPNPCPAPFYNICQVVADDPNGVSLMVGQRVTVEGVALCDGMTWSTTIREFQITDGDCCVDIFGGSLLPAVALGDRVRVTGTVSNYNGKTEIQTPDLTVVVLSSGNPLPVPAIVTTGQLAASGDSYTNCLFQVHCVNIVGGDPWPAVGINANVTIDDGTGPVTMRIDKDTDIDGTPVPTTDFSVIGIGDQFDTSSPYTTGWQIKPRSLADIVYDCAPPTGACCFPNGSCLVLTAAECATQGGAYQGNSTLCEPNPCQQPSAACCYPDGHCEFVVQIYCPYQWQGYGSNCEPNLCQQPSAACCYPDGRCEFVLAANCTGQWLGYGWVCDPNPCNQPFGACCAPDGTCTYTLEANCTGNWLGYGSVCEPNPCPPPPGACCAPTGDCMMIPQAQCVAPNVWYGGLCDPNPCPAPGACCAPSGECSFVLQANCTLPNVWYGGPCQPNPCPPTPTEKTTWGRIKNNYR